MTARDFTPTDELAQEIRRVDGRHDLGAGALAEALMPWLIAREKSVIAAAKAEALRDLADERRLAQRDGVGSPWMVAEWLSAEADRIEAGLPDEDDDDEASA